MIIFGIDPGYAIVARGCVLMKGAAFFPLDFGAVLTPAGMDFSRRLELIYDELTALFVRFQPDALSVEKLYFKNNQKTAIDVAEARGVILLAAQKQRLPLFEYTPLQVKSAVTGYGKAEKPQVMEMTRRLLGSQRGSQARRYRRCAGADHLSWTDGRQRRSSAGWCPDVEENHPCERGMALFYSVRRRADSCGSPYGRRGMRRRGLPLSYHDEHGPADCPLWGKRCCCTPCCRCGKMPWSCSALPIRRN